MNQMLRLTVPGLNFLFSQFADLENKFLWVTTPGYTRQIYIGLGYEKIWGRPCEELYNDISSWHISLIEKDREKVVQALKARKSYQPENQQEVFYCFHNSLGEVRFIKDICFYLLDQSGQEIAIAGVAETISQTQYEQKTLKQDSDKDREADNHFNNDLLALFNKEFKLVSGSQTVIADQVINEARNKSSLVFSEETSKLTPREKECLMQLSTGQSAKKIARVLDISPRTVEIHIDNIKRKLECRTRLEVISKLNSAAAFY